MDTSLNIVQANEKATKMFGIGRGQIKGRSCVQIIHPDSIDSFLEASSIKDGEVWHGEVNCICAGEDIFPASITVNKFFLGGDVFLHIIVCNITEQKAMESHLRDEKTKAEEMNVTLKNVMKAIDRNKEEFELSITQKISPPALFHPCKNWLLKKILKFAICI